MAQGAGCFAHNLIRSTSSCVNRFCPIITALSCADFNAPPPIGACMSAATVGAAYHVPRVGLRHGLL